MVDLLVIEPSVSMRKTLERLLESNGYTMRGVVRGEDAEQQIRRQRPDLILSTNQFAAFDWLVNTDPRQVCPENAVDVRQRYILSLLYYSTSGDGWLTCNSPDAQVLAPCTNASRYLSEDSICNWAGNTCNGAGNLRFLSLGKLLEDLFALP